MADGKITVEVSTQAVQAELERLRHENARLAREAHTWWTACAGATAELERLRDAIGRNPPSERQGLTDGWRKYVQSVDAGFQYDPAAGGHIPTVLVRFSLVREGGSETNAVWGARNQVASLLSRPPDVPATPESAG